MQNIERETNISTLIFYWYYCTVRFQRTSHAKKYTYAFATLWTLPMAPPLSPHFHSLTVSPFFYGCQKNKKIPQYMRKL